MDAGRRDYSEQSFSFQDYSHFFLQENLPFLFAKKNENLPFPCRLTRISHSSGTWNNQPAGSSTGGWRRVLRTNGARALYPWRTKRVQFRSNSPKIPRYLFRSLGLAVQRHSNGGSGTLALVKKSPRHCFVRLCLELSVSYHAWQV
jgi:hypothetical protein